MTKILTLAAHTWRDGHKRVASRRKSIPLNRGDAEREGEKVFFSLTVKGTHTHTHNEERKVFSPGG